MKVGNIKHTLDSRGTILTSHMQGLTSFDDGGVHHKIPQVRCVYTTNEPLHNARADRDQGFFEVRGHTQESI